MTDKTLVARTEMTNGVETLSFPTGSVYAMEALGWALTPAARILADESEALDAARVALDEAAAELAAADEAAKAEEASAAAAELAATKATTDEAAAPVDADAHTLAGAVTNATPATKRATRAGK